MFFMKLLSEGGPNTSLAWLLWVALGFFLLIILIGWWQSGKQKPAEETVRTHGESGHEDDLTILEGIGPKVVKVLKDAGIASFADLAAANAAEVQKALDAAGLQMMNPEGWIEQAKLAAKGDMDELKKLQDELKGGRRV